MNMKRFLLINSLVLSILGASVASAQAPGQNVDSVKKAGHCRQHSGKMLTPAQRKELYQIRKEMRAQLTPLIKEKRALGREIRGKMATPNAKWSDVSGLVAQRNAVNAKISTVWAKTQFQTFQKLGILLPHHHGHHYRNQNKNFAKK